MSWSHFVYGVALTVIVGAVIALCGQWRERRAAREAHLTRSRLDARASRGRHDATRDSDRRTDRAA
jgi:hypothetical protein